MKMPLQEPSSEDSAQTPSTSEWEWLYADETPCEGGSETRHRPPKGRHASRVVVGARLGSDEFYRGDCVLLRAESSGPPWVAIIRRFTTDDHGQMAGDFVWFSNEKEIRNTARKRTDFLPVRTTFPPRHQRRRQLLTVM